MYTWLFRIWPKVFFAPTGCWLWTGATSQKRGWQRRPSFHHHGRTVNPASLMCELLRGPRPSSDHHAGHTCPVREESLCVNPWHLRWMTPLQNEAQKRVYRVDKS
jgi:hypothetical protein